MTLVAPTVAPLAKGLSVATSHTAPKASATPLSEAPRSSTGEFSAANIKSETSRAIDAAGQSAVAPRLRDQETTERSNRLSARRDAPTGPPPTFDESLLERRSRTALDPPEITEQTKAPPPSEKIETDQDPPTSPPTFVSDAPPTPTEKAEAGFAETRAISDTGHSVTLDVKG